MPALKAKKLRKLPQEKVLLELCSRLANSIRRVFESCNLAGIRVPSIAEKMVPPSEKFTP
jgi:hypothetical protein